MEETNDSDKPYTSNPKKDLPYVIARTYSAGVFAGYLQELKGKECTILSARRLWCCDGAANLSQLAMEGTRKSDKFKFPCEVDMIKLTEIIEIDFCTEKAKKSIKEVPIWKA